MASILSFIAKGVFDDATLRVMGQAFDAAYKELHDDGTTSPSSRSHGLNGLLPQPIDGERNVTRLRDIALAALAAHEGAPITVTRGIPVDIRDALIR